MNRIFFPSLGTRAADGGWLVEVHAWCFRMHPLSLLAAPDRYKLKTIEPLLKRLPHRRFVLVGDSGQQDPEIFGELARRYPRQVRRIFIRNLMDSGQTLRYRAAFGGVNSELWSIFRDPSTLPRALTDGGPRAGVSG